MVLEFFRTQAHSLTQLFDGLRQLIHQHQHPAKVMMRRRVLRISRNRFL